MRILSTNDLHGNRSAYRWLARQSPSYDLTLIAGDLMSAFHDPKASIGERAQQVASWIELQIKKRRPLAICTGNHDWLGEIQNNGPSWVHQLVPSPLLTVDLMSRIYTGANGWRVIVTSLPFNLYKEPLLDQASETALHEGATLRKKERIPWIVLHHDPPDGTALCHGEEYFIGSTQLVQWIEKFSPHYVISGHIHESPFRSGCWAKRVGFSWCFNVGQRINGSTPCHLVLDLEKREARRLFVQGTKYKRLIDDRLEFT